MSLYHHPEIYAALLYPEPDLIEDIETWIEDHLEGPWRSLMDPACGPGTWLVPFAEHGKVVAGNDLEPRMIAEARLLLRDAQAELVVGDMQRLRFENRPFDVAINLHGSIGHLPDDYAVIEHLRSVAEHLRPGGLYFLGLTVSDGDRIEDVPDVLYQSKPTKLSSGGIVAVLYESVWRDPIMRRERIRLHLLAKNVSQCPEILREEYDLLTFPAARVREILDEVHDFDLLATHAMSVEDRPDLGLIPGAGDVTLVLRRRRRKQRPGKRE